MRTYRQIKEDVYLNSSVRHSQFYSVPDVGNNIDTNVPSCWFYATDQANGVHRTDSSIWVSFDRAFELLGMYFSRYKFTPSVGSTKSAEANDSVTWYNSTMLCSLNSDVHGEICRDIDIGSVFARASRDMYLNSFLAGPMGIGMEFYCRSGNHHGILGGIGAPTLTPDPLTPVCNQFVNPEGRGIIFLEKETLQITTSKQTIDRNLIYTDASSRRQCVLVGRELDV